MSGMELKERIRVLEANLDRQVHWIAAADTRAPLGLAISTAMLGSLAASAGQADPAWPKTTLLLAGAAGTLLLASLGCLASANFPRTRSNGGSSIYFGDLAKLSNEAFEKQMDELDETSYLLDLQQQCRRNAQIANAKFRWVRRSQLALHSSIVPWALAVLALRA